MIRTLFALLLTAALSLTAAAQPQAPDALQMPTPGEVEGTHSNPEPLPAPGAVVYARDYGVVADPAVDNGPAIVRAIAAACAIGPAAPADGSAPLSLPVVQFDPGTFGYVSIGIPCDVWLRGVGGAQIVAVPGSRIPRVVEAQSLGLPETRLRVLDRWAADRLAGRVGSSRIQLRPEPATYRQVENVNWRNPTRSYHAFVVTDMVLDGNEEANAPPYAAATSHEREEDLRNGSAWSGIVAGNEGGVNLCKDRAYVAFRIPSVNYVQVKLPRLQGARVYVEGAVVTGYGAVAMQGGACAEWSIVASRIGRSAYNHDLYGADGGVPNPRIGMANDTTGSPVNGFGGWHTVTLVGKSWTAVVTKFGLDAVALRYEPGDWSPLRAQWEGPDMFSNYGLGGTVRGLALDAPLGEGPMPSLLTYADTTAGGSWPILFRTLPADYAPPRPLYVEGGTPPPVEPPPAPPVEPPPPTPPAHDYRCMDHGVTPPERVAGALCAQPDPAPAPDPEHDYRSTPSGRCYDYALSPARRVAASFCSQNP